MPNIIVQKSTGERLEITLSTLFGCLADQSSHMDVLSRLNREGFVTVELRDGIAQLWRVKPTNLALQPALPLGEFTADTRLHFELPARIHCRAGSPAEAAHIIQETVTGARGMSAGFKIEMDPTEVQAFIGSLDVGNLAVVQDVTIHRIDQRLLLTRETAS